MKVRPAAKDDLAAIMEMGQAFFEESGLSDCTDFDGNSFHTAVRKLIEGNFTGIILVAEDERIVGMAACLIYPFYFNVNTSVAQEIFWYCEPDHRFGAGAALLDELEQAAKRRGVSVFIAASMSGLRDSALLRLYRRRGYKPAENTYIKRM